MGKTCSFLSKETIIQLHRDAIDVSGGAVFAKGVLHNEGSLDYAVEIIQTTMFDVDKYPGVIDKGLRLRGT